MQEGLAGIPVAAATGLSFDMMNLLLVLVAAWSAGRIAERVGYPAVLGELLAGIVLGPPLLGLLSGGEGLAVIADLGVILMMLYIGMEIDFEDLRRASWPGLLAATGGFVVPAVLGYAVVIAFGGTVLAALFVGISVGVTSLATKSRILVDLDLLDTRIAYVLMAGALLSDTATLIGFAAIIGFVEAGGFDLAGTVQVAGEAAAFFAVAGFLGLVVLPRLSRLWRRWMTRGNRMLGFAFVVTVGLVFAELAELAGLHAILGAFVGGMFLQRDVFGKRVQHEVETLLADVSIGFLAPVFFVTAGFQITFDVFQTDLALLISVVAVAMIGKIVGTALFYIPSGYGWREGMVVGFGMNGRGAVEIIVAGIGLQLGLITPELFTILVFMAIATTATVPVLVTAGVRWLRGRGELARAEERRTDVAIVGAGPVARLLAKLLEDHRQVRLIDANADRCEVARRAGFTVVRGDVLDPETLDEAHLGEARTMLALTTNSEVNILAAQLAKEDFHVPVVVAAVGETANESAVELLDRIGAVPLRSGSVDLGRWNQLVAAGRAATSSIHLLDEPELGDMAARLADGRGELPLLINRDGEAVPMAEVDELQVGDEVIVLQRSEDAPTEPPWAAIVPS